MGQRPSDLPGDQAWAVIERVRELTRARDDVKSAVAWMEQFQRERDAARAELARLAEDPDWFQEWSNELAGIVDDGDESTYSNPEAAQEAILLDVFRAYKQERDQARAAIERVRQLHVMGSTTRSTYNHDGTLVSSRPVPSGHCVACSSSTIECCFDDEDLCDLPHSGSKVAYPCPTIRALDTADQEQAADELSRLGQQQGDGPNPLVRGGEGE